MNYVFLQLARTTQNEDSGKDYVTSTSMVSLVWQPPVQRPANGSLRANAETASVINGKKGSGKNMKERTSQVQV